MAATTAGAIKAWLEAQGLGISVFRDRAPAGKALPYLTVHEAIATIPDSLEDGQATTATETIQVDIWQTWRTQADAITESMTLAPAVIRALQGCRLSTAPTVVYMVLVRNVMRMVEDDNNVVHHAITCEVMRAL